MKTPVDQLTCETSLSTSAEHSEGQKCLGPTAVISSPSENYYSYYAKTVPFTEVGNGTFNALTITIPMVIRFVFNITYYS